MMPQKHFWQLIDHVNAAVECADKITILQATKAQLSRFSSQEILEWYKRYDQVVKKADRVDLWRACADCGIHASNDGFYYFRAWLVSQGKDVYTSVLEDPEKLSEYVPDPEEASFEGYNYVTWDVYAQKACEEELGREGMEQYRKQWLSEHVAEIHDFRGPYESPEECGKRLFKYHLEDKYDILEDMTKRPSLVKKIQAAAEKEDMQQHTVQKRPKEPER